MRVAVAPWRGGVRGLGGGPRAAWQLLGCLRERGEGPVNQFKVEGWTRMAEFQFFGCWIRTSETSPCELACGESMPVKSPRMMQVVAISESMKHI